MNTDPVDPQVGQEADPQAPEGPPSARFGETQGPSGDTSQGDRRSRLSDDPEELVGKTLGKYKVVELLGRGGMGIVYRAHDPMIERDVAIKVLPEDCAADEMTFRRFHSEARSAGRLSHPNAVAIYDVGQDGDVHFLVMELVTGGSVEEDLDRLGPYSPADATQILIQAVRGVAAAHGMKIIHRDIKPANLLKTKGGVIKVSDFGLAKTQKPEAQTMTQAGLVVGTPYFMSPEQCQGQQLDHRTDIYSLGATYFAMLTRQNPYQESAGVMQLMYAHCHAEVPNPRDVKADIPHACVDVVQRAMAKSAGDRYQTAAEMLEDLEAFIAAKSPDAVKLPSSAKLPPVSSGGSTSGAAPSDTPGSSWFDRLPISRPVVLMSAAGLGLVILLSVVGFALFGGGDTSPAAAPDGPETPAAAAAPVEITIAYGTEKKKWLQWAADEFAKTPESGRIKVHLVGMGSVEGAQAVLDGPGEQPIHVWSPASATYRDVFERDWIERHGGSSPIATANNLALSPMVFVMWRERYELLKKKYGELNFHTLLSAMEAERGWETIADRPDWRQFNFSHTSPQLSNSGVVSLVLLAYHRLPGDGPLTLEEVEQPDFRRWVKRFESQVAPLGQQLLHSTGTLMRTMVERGPSSYDCVLVYENLAIENFKAAAGRFGEIVVVYPEENLWNENPYYVLDVPWSSDAQQAAARTFLDFLMSEAVQRRAIDHGFRPGNLDVPIRFAGSPFLKHAPAGIRIDVTGIRPAPSAEVLRSLLATFDEAGR